MAGLQARHIDCGAWGRVKTSLNWAFYVSKRLYSHFSDEEFLYYYFFVVVVKIQS